MCYIYSVSWVEPVDIIYLSKSNVNVLWRLTAHHAGDDYFEFIVY